MVSSKQLCCLFFVGLFWFGLGFLIQLCLTSLAFFSGDMKQRFFAPNLFVEKSVPWTFWSSSREVNTWWYLLMSIFTFQHIDILLLPLQNIRGKHQHTTSHPPFGGGTIPRWFHSHRKEQAKESPRAMWILLQLKQLAAPLWHAQPLHASTPGLETENQSPTRLRAICFVFSHAVEVHGHLLFIKSNCFG